MQCCRIVNGIKNKNIKNSLGAMWNALHLAVRLCVLRHWKQVSMPPTTHSLRQMRSIPRCSKAVFYIFVFDRIHNSATMHNHCPQKFSNEPKKNYRLNFFNFLTP